MMTNKRFIQNEFYNVPIFETEHFKVLPSLGSMIEGWLLVVPKKHFLNFGQIYATKFQNELNHLLLEVRSQIHTKYGEYIIFEHGPIIEDTTVGCGVDHAHIHIVPMSISIEDVIEYSTQTLTWNEISGIEEISKYANNRQSYLYFQDCFLNSYIATSKEIESQFFRRIIARMIGKPEIFNWNDYHFLENIKRTYKSFNKYAEEIQHQN